MRFEISKYEKVYSFELDGVAQLCGQNIQSKTFIFESIRRYFGTYKYSEETNPWRDNIKIDGDVLGRKYFQVVSIRQKEDMLQHIRLTKKSMLLEYIHEMIQKFSFQQHLQQIDIELEKMYLELNQHIEDMGDIRLSYDICDVWDMVQESNVETEEGDLIDDKESFEVIDIFLRMLEQLQQQKPRKLLVLFENIDHMINIDEYKECIKKMEKLSRKYDIQFICSTSLEYYVMITPELCEGISVFGEEILQMPDLEHLLDCIQMQYPYEKEWTEEHIQEYLSQIIQQIGQNSYLKDIQSNVLCKIINKSLLLEEKMEFNMTQAEKAYLRS